MFSYILVGKDQNLNKYNKSNIYAAIINIKEYMNSQANKIPKQEKAHIKLTISTWVKDSHGLYDYQSSSQSYKTETLKIQNTTMIYRDSVATRTLILSKNQNKLPIRQSFLPIASLVFDKKQSKSTSSFRFQPFRHPQATDTFNYDTTKTFYKVLRQKNPQNSKNQGFALKPGHIIKMGRVQYMVIQMKNNKQTLTIRDTYHINQSNGIFEFKKKKHQKIQQDGSQIRCKVCLCSQETDEDPLISPCHCKGTLLKIHVGCLRQWINSKVKKQINDIATSYNFTKFECELCKTPFPKVIKLEEKQIQMMTISKPSKPYIILQSLNRTGQLAKEQRCLHLIAAKQNSQIKIGRGHQCEIRLTDISVSRSHAKIIFLNDEFFIKDQKSKFGTLIKFEGIHLFEPQNIFSVQYGRTLFQFELIVPQEEDTQQENQQIKQQVQKQPAKQQN